MYSKQHTMSALRKKITDPRVINISGVCDISGGFLPPTREKKYHIWLLCVHHHPLVVPLRAFKIQCTRGRQFMGEITGECDFFTHHPF